jgi:hypothetical protein
MRIASQKKTSPKRPTLNKDGTPRKAYTKSGKPRKPYVLTKIRKSRSNQLLNHLLKGRTISGTQALRTFGIYRLSGVIHEFRKRGINIETKMIKRKGRTYGVYKFVEKKAK